MYSFVSFKTVATDVDRACAPCTAFTVQEAVHDVPVTVAVTVVWPSRSAVTLPDASTDMTEGSALFHSSEKADVAAAGTGDTCSVRDWPTLTDTSLSIVIPVISAGVSMMKMFSSG